MEDVKLLEYIHKHPEIAVDLEYKIRKEELHNAIMKEVQRAFDEGDVTIKNIEDFCTLVELDLFLLEGER